jgi:hypothetical protein
MTTLVRSCRWYRRPYGVWSIETWKLCFERDERSRIFGA